MSTHTEETRQKVYQLLLKPSNSRKTIEKRTGVTFKTIQHWEEEWRNQGLLPKCKRVGMNFVNKARAASNGYYMSIRKRFNGMRWNDKINNREFGFANQVESIPYFLDNGQPRPCTYCGSLPTEGKVWGLDRLDSSLGHIPGNLVPCCGATGEGSQMMCQASKSKFLLRDWLAFNMSRTFGRPVADTELDARIKQITDLAELLRVTLTPTAV